MVTRKDMKKKAKAVVRSHYGLLLAVCLVAAFLGTEFVNSLDFLKQYRTGTEQTAQTVTTVAGGHRESVWTAVGSALMGNLEEGQQISQDISQQLEEKSDEGEMLVAFGRSRGVLASILNGIDSGSLLIHGITAARNMGVSRDMILALFIAAAMVLFTGVWFLFTNIYKVISRRIFLESRTYEKVPFQRFLFLLRVKKWLRCSVTMFMTWLFQLLWSATVIGGVIKRYSYYMVPYLAAENPDAGWRETITLSRRMMKGHKWECFVYELSFLLWDILGIFTLGASNLFFANAYKTAFFSEYYAALREKAREDGMEGAQLMNDVWLFQKAGEQTLREAYTDLAELQAAKIQPPVYHGFRKMLAEVFGITVVSRKEEEAYEEAQMLRQRLASEREQMEGTSYPTRLFTIPEEKKNVRAGQINYLRYYSIPSLILLYFIFAGIGWLWEVSLHLITDGEFVNRGVLHGPWLPIYGTGGLLILILLNKLRRHPAAEFFAAVVLCGCVEYFTAFYLEMTHGGKKWWDYSGYFLNLHGRICAEGLLVFGVGGMAIVYFAAPLLDNALRRLKYRYAVILCAALLAVFAVDQVYSGKHPNEGKGITDYKEAYLETLDWDNGAADNEGTERRSL